MATASGTMFGTSGLFGAASTGTPAFGTPSTTTQAASSGFTFGAVKPTTSSNTLGLSLGASVSQPSSSTTGFGFASFGAKPSATVSAFSATKTSSQPTGFGSLSTATSAATSSNLFGSNLFGAKTTASSLTAPFPLQTSSSSNQSLPLFGGASSSATVQPAVSLTAATATGQKAPENPRDAQVAMPLMQAYQEVSKHIKEQRAKKDEITRYSAKLIFKANEDIINLRQLVSEVSNGMQRDTVGVEALKGDISQELNFAEVARRLHNVPTSLHHDYTAPLEYFQWLIVTFESRIKSYKQQLDELEMYLSTPTQVQNFTPQDLFNILRQLNDTFLGLAAQLHGVHEVIQALKSRYLQYRAVVLNDTTDIFTNRQRTVYRDGNTKGSGPSPFAGLAGPSAVAMAAALSQSNPGGQSSILLGSFGAAKTDQTSISKTGSSFGTSGLSRSLSFSGLSTRGTGTSLSLGSSLIGTSFGDFTSSATKTPQFQLQNPPGTKRGKKN